MGSTPPVSRMYKRHAFTVEDDDDDMEEDENQVGTDPVENDMDWQPFEAGSSISGPNTNDVDMTEDTPNDTAEIKLRPAVFNPNDEWGLTAYGVKGLDGLFAKGVSLDDIRLDTTEKRTFKNMLHSTYMVAAIACICAVCTVYALLLHIPMRE